MKARKSVLVLLLLCLLAGSGCYWKKQVESNEVGLKLDDGVTVNAVVGAGRYSKGGWYSDLEIIDTRSKTVSWTDPDLVTKDKQPIGIELGLTYRRNNDPISIVNMWDVYRNEALNDNALAASVSNRIPRVAKEITTNYTLDEILGIAESGGREVVASNMFDLLEAELLEIGVILLDVGINNISVDEGYMAALKRKAAAQIESEIAVEETKKLGEQLQQETAQTEIDLEVARRQNLVNTEMAKAYEESPQLLELRRLELMAQVIGDNDKLVFVPEGTSLNVIIGSEFLMTTDN